MNIFRIFGNSDAISGDKPLPALHYDVSVGDRTARIGRDADMAAALTFLHGDHAEQVARGVHADRQVTEEDMRAAYCDAAGQGG